MLNSKIRDILKKLKNRARGRIIVTDIDNDGKPEIAFLSRGRFLRTYYGEREYLYELAFVDEIESRPLKKLITKFYGKPGSLIVEDIDGDGKLDIVFIQKGKYLCIKNEKVIFLYSLMFMDGKGDGTFDRPKKIATMRGLPDDI